MSRSKLACILVLAAGAVPAARGAPLAAPVPYEVTASVLQVRAGPGAQHAILGAVERDQVYPVVELAGSWARIQLGGAPGRQTWCSLDHLRRTADPIRWTLATELNVRAGPGVRFRLLGRLSRGTPLAIVDVTPDGWAKTSYEGTTAWVSAQWLGTARPGAATPPPARPTSSVGFIQLAASGVGFESYAVSSGRWGRPSLVYAIERVGRRWAQLRRDRIGVGDLSLAGGGPFPPHAGHRQGREVDIAPVRSDARELPVSIFDAAYSRTWTARLVDLFRAEVALDVVLFNDARVPGVVRWPGHDDHLHLRIR